MRITTLGALAVDGRPVRGERLAAVIRELVEARGRTLTTGALVDAVWQGAPPEDAAGAVQALVSRVRRLGLPVLAAPGGYRMPVDAVEIDAVTVRELVDRGRRALLDGDAGRAGGWADEARALFPQSPELVDAGPARLFGDVVALRAEAALAAGGPFEEADLRRLVARVPPDEPAAALLVRVLAAQGRDAEALDLVERVRVELAERYGADPSPRLVEAHLALLRGQLRAPAPPAGPRGAVPAAWRRALTPLVGRGDELAALRRAMAQAALVTVVAIGGAGKTRLAAEIVRSLSGSRPVRVVELAGIREPAEVRPAVLAAFCADHPSGPANRVQDVSPALDGLLVLDNCEHVLAAVADVVGELLALAPAGFGVLATSRAPLGLVGEVVHRLAALPDDEALGLLEGRVRAGGGVVAGPRERVLELCHRLDNLPLALELAAARLRHMPIDDVLGGLGDRFGLLDDALRGLPNRHAGLWAMVDWSRELLEPGEQEMLERLAVIPGPFTAELAEAVSGRGRRDLAGLVEQSLLRLEPGDGGALGAEPASAGTARYRMLETVREYGEARLDAAGGRAGAVAGLVGWGARHAVDLGAAFIGPGQIRALESIAADQDNLVAALRWGQYSGAEAQAVDIALALLQLWTVRGRHLEANAVAGSLLHADDPGARRRSAILHGRAAGQALPHADRLAWLCILISVNAGNGGSMRLIALARRALKALFAERAAEVSARSTALAAALPGLERADPDRSLADAAVLVAHPDPYVRGMGHFIRAVLIDSATGRADPSGDAELAYRLFEAVGDHWGMGMAAHAAGHSSAAGEWLRRSERHLELVGAEQDARTTQVLLDIHLAQSGDREAERRLHAALAAEDIDTAGQARLGLAELAWRRDRPEETLAHTEALIGAIAEAAPDRPVAVLRVAVAVLHLWAADVQPPGAAAARAAEVLRRSRPEVLAAHDRPLLGAWAMGGAELAATRGDVATARELWALGTRVGAAISRFFPAGRGPRLTAALGDDEARDRLLATAAALSGPVIHSRVTALMADLLAQVP
ncbi:transcriptional regulator [Dactylosporangium vinaceum]|uniref:BTAD domain-containing putative transcriptional regulator n=1 Tax=Dactylosporangium vinaceum TaxID=53362 RepID=A0ABV5M6H6_9ACTN|nr:BTAD domain-containing putative transcriptional regulator [Dactylosporangium vinaceum]UAB97863.1 transcriptional regulator [Dactylosporangium vinaceum]